MSAQKNAKSYTIDMCEGSILKKLLLFALPLIASSVLQLFFNAADVIVVGKFAGDHALAAVGSNGSIINLLTNVFMGLSVGANVLVARYFAAKQEKDEYLEMFKPKPYSSIRNFMVSQMVTLLYQQAISELSDDKDYGLDSTLTITDSIGNIYQYTYQYAYDIKIGMMYVTERNVVFVINQDKCIKCGACLDSCPFKAIKED